MSNWHVYVCKGHRRLSEWHCRKSLVGKITFKLSAAESILVILTNKTWQSELLQFERPRSNIPRQCCPYFQKSNVIPLECHMDRNMSAVCCQLFRNFSYWRLKGSFAAHSLAHRPLIAEAWVQSQTIQCGVFDGYCDTRKDFSPSTMGLPCQYHSDNAPFWFFHASKAL